MIGEKRLGGIESGGDRVESVLKNRISFVFAQLSETSHIGLGKSQLNPANKPGVESASLWGLSHKSTHLKVYKRLNPGIYIHC